MAKAGTQSEATVSPQTRCTSCRTVFEVSPELLSSSDTRVRCGECLSIFDALANLRDPEADETDSPPSAEAGGDGAATPPAAGAQTTAERSASEAAAASFAEVADGAGPIEVTYTDFDLFSADAALPEVSYLDATADTADFDFDEIDIEDDDETFSDTLFADDATVEPATVEAEPGTAIEGDDATLEPETDFVVDEGPTETLDFRYHDAEGAGEGDGRSNGERAEAGSGDARGEAPPLGSEGTFLPMSVDARDAPASPRAGGGRGMDVLPAEGGSWLAPAILLLLLGALLAGLYLHRGRHELHNDPLVRPLLVLGCRVGGCTVPSRVDLAALRLVGREVYTHPRVPGALVIGVTFENTADFDQRYPVLVVRLRDRTGRTVAERAFEPAEYLDEWRAGDTVAADERLDISLEVDDPGDGADSYEFEFREARG